MPARSHRPASPVDVNADLLAIAFAHGLVIAVMVSAVGHISGGHFNPAVTLGFFVTRRLATSLTVAYLVAQFGAAVLAALLIKWIFPGDSAESVGYGAPAIDPGLGTAEALVVEARPDVLPGLGRLRARLPTSAARSRRSPASRSAS